MVTKEQAAAARDAKVKENAEQDTSKIATVEDPANAEKREGVRPAAGTAAQVVEAGPGVEVDADLDRAEVDRAKSGDLSEASDSDLLTAAQAKAPQLTAEFVTQYGLVRRDLEAIARGEVPPPPAVGPVHSKDLHLTPGGWQVTAVSVPPEDSGKNAVSR